MFKRIALLTVVTSLLTVGCATTPSAVVTHSVQNLPVEPAKSVVPMVRITPSNAVKTRAPTTISPSVAISGHDRANILACVELAKPDLVRPDTIQPNLSKTKVTTNSKGITTVKMPFSVLNVKNEGRDNFIMATCKFTKAGKGTILLEGI